MKNYTVQTAAQLKPIIAGFRKASGMTQEDLAALLGITQQTYSAAERNASNMSVARLLSVLNTLDVELVLRPKSSSTKVTPTSTGSSAW